MPAGMADDSRVIEGTERALKGLLADEGILSGDTDQCETETGKRALDLYCRFEEEPESIAFKDIHDLAHAGGSQIGNKDGYLKHIHTTSGVGEGMITALAKRHPNLIIPEPDAFSAACLVHDTNATFSDYKKGGQESKEFDEFLLAERFAWANMAEHVSMHSGYLEIIELMERGEQPANPEHREAYNGMYEVLQGDGPLSYKAIRKRFQGFIDGRENLPLILLTVADYIAAGDPAFSPDTLEKDFEERSGDILWRYHGKAIDEGRVPSLLGRGLKYGGIDRITRYKDIVAALLKGEGEAFERLRANPNFFS